MGQITLVPDGDIDIAAIAGASGQFLPPSMFRYLDDDSTTTWIQLNGGADSSVRFSLTSVTLPAGAVTSTVRVRVRGAGYLGGETLTATLALSGGATVATASLLVASGTPNMITGTVTAITLSQADIDGFTIRLARSGANGAYFYDTYVDLVYAEIPLVDVIAPSGPTLTISPTVAWSYTAGADGGAQSHYQVRVFDNVQYAIGGFDPATSPATYDSGVVASAAVSAVVGPLANSTVYRAYVRVAQTINGTAQWSLWDFSGFNVSAPLSDDIEVVGTIPASFAFTGRYRPTCQVYDGTIWKDISCYVHEGEIHRGREHFTDRFEPATATVTVDNRDGYFDLAGDPSDIQARPVRPGREMRIGIEGPWELPAFGSFSTEWLFRGFVDHCKPTYDPVLEDIVTIDAIDALGEVGSVRLAALAVAVGASETVTVRIGRILDAASQTASRRDLDASTVTVLATVMGTQAMDELGKTADSAGGAIFGNLDGGISYRDRDWMLYDTGPDGTIGNVGDGDVCPTGWEVDFDRAQMITQVEIGRSITPAELPTLYEDLPAIADYGREPFSRTDLINANTTIFSTLADRWFAMRGVESMPRIEAVSLDASTGEEGDGVGITWADVVNSNADWSAFMASTATWGTISMGSQSPVIELMATCAPELPSRYHCQLTTYSGRQVIDRMMFAVGVRHFVSRNEWTLRIALDSAEWAEQGGF